MIKIILSRLLLPVGVAFASDGALLFTGDASGSVWRVSR
jgi:glucose/arabinose dehydrogenase